MRAEKLSAGEARLRGVERQAGKQTRFGPGAHKVFSQQNQAEVITSFF